MLPILLGAIALAPVYWLVVPVAHRRTALTAGSLAGLALYDPRLVALVAGVSAALAVVARAAYRTARRRGALTALSLAGLAALFVWNKHASGGLAVPSQQGLMLLGVSYLVLKAAAVMIDVARDALAPPRPRDLLAWIAFLPTYPAGPIEDLDHFRSQTPRFDRARALVGLERILFGLVKALLVAHYLGVWAGPIVGAPAGHGRAVLLLALYAFTLRFYLDFSGYSDIAIGIAALFGYTIEENFDWPLVRRNLGQLWQRWHMTLTRWLRVYLFIPFTRFLIRRGRGDDRAAAVLGQAVTMTACGLWHGLAWHFALWGLLQGLGLAWVAVGAREFGRRLPPGLLGWWRQSSLAYALSTAITFNAFALSAVFVVTDVAGGVRYLRLLMGT